MDTSIWGNAHLYKARLNSPLAGTAPAVRNAVEGLTVAHPDLALLRGAFRSTPLQPQAGIPIFGLLIVIGGLILALVIWLIATANRFDVGKLVGPLVLLAIALSLIAFGGMKVRVLVRDLGQLLLIFENGLAHVRPDGTTVIRWHEIGDVRHELVRLEYGGMDIGTEHVYTVKTRDGRQLVLLGRTYPRPDPPEPTNAEAGELLLSDAQQVGDFIESHTITR